MKRNIKGEKKKRFSGRARDIAAGVGLGVLAIGPTIPGIANGADLTVHNLGNGDECSPFGTQRTRMSLSGKLGTAIVDVNTQGKPNEAFLWVNGPSFGNGRFYTGFLAQGTPNVNADGAYCDFGPLVGAKIGKYTLDFIGAPTIQKDGKPLAFYQATLGGIDGDKGKLLASVVDDSSKPFTAKDLDFRGYVTGKVGDALGGIGIRSKGTDVTRVYGSAGAIKPDFGTLTVFSHDCDDPSTPENEANTWFKMQNAWGNPSEGFYNVDVANLWNNIKGPGTRDVGTPYLGTFLCKGTTTAKLEGSVAPGCSNYEAMVGRAVETALLGRVALGAGVNYHNENEKTTYGALVHADVSKKIGSNTRLGLEGRFGPRKNSVFVKVQRSFGRNK